MGAGDGGGGSSPSGDHEMPRGTRSLGSWPFMDHMGGLYSHNTEMSSFSQWNVLISSFQKKKKCGFSTLSLKLNFWEGYEEKHFYTIGENNDQGSAITVRAHAEIHWVGDGKAVGLCRAGEWASCKGLSPPHLQPLWAWVGIRPIVVIAFSFSRDSSNLNIKFQL